MTIKQDNKLKEINKIIGSNIKTFRQHNNISRYKLAKDLTKSFGAGFSYSLIKQYEEGNSKIYATKLKIIADYLKVGIRNLFDNVIITNNAVTINDLIKQTTNNNVSQKDITEYIHMFLINNSVEYRGMITMGFKPKEGSLIVKHGTEVFIDMLLNHKENHIDFQHSISIANKGKTQ